ncbi:ABC transporter ATP-binding protein [Blautia hominis]|uniref:ABC transporter ATP-binding protein n=1 Tax=Blautia hominis TaxID=2025493 RepID=A0ABQ0BFQ9_9FIRM
MGNIKSLFKLKTYLKKYRIKLIIGILGTIISPLLAVPVPYMIGYIVDNVLIKTKNFKLFGSTVIIILLLYIFSYLISMGAKVLISYCGNYLVNDISVSIIKKIMDLPMNYMRKKEKGYMQERISECDSIANIFSTAIISAIASVLTIIFTIIIMFRIDMILSISTILLCPIFYLISKATTTGFAKSTYKKMESSAILNGEYFEIINGIEHVKIYGGKGIQLSKVKNKIAEVTRSGYKQNKYMIFLTENINILNNIGTLLILFLAGVLIFKGNFTVGLYTSFSIYSNKIFGCTQQLAATGITLKPVCISIERIFEILEMKGESEINTTSLKEKITQIEFKNICFKYGDDSSEILRNLNFTLHGGEKVLLSGENGSGKTTVVKLLLQFYQPTSGKIVLNKCVDLNCVNCDSLREKIAIVSQDTFLFKGTVLDNILYGQIEKNKNDVKYLIKMLQLESYIDRLPDGLDTIIQNSEGISGGQAQTIAFIRALLQKKDVIILDEPLSNLDVKTKKIFTDILRIMDYPGILIVISHDVEGLEFINKNIKLVS